MIYLQETFQWLVYDISGQEALTGNLSTTETHKRFLLLVKTMIYEAGLHKKWSEFYGNFWVEKNAHLEHFHKLGCKVVKWSEYGGIDMLQMTKKKKEKEKTWHQTKPLFRAFG